MGLRFFCGHARLALQMSTVIRMNYLCQPIAGLLFITANFFQDGSVSVSSVVRADNYKMPAHEALSLAVMAH